MRPPGKYDALRGSEQGEPPEQPTRPEGHPASYASHSDMGVPSLKDWAKEIAEAAKAHEDAAKARDTEKGKGGNER